MEKRPFQVYLDTIARCNLRCRMCLVAYEKERYARKPPQIAERLRSLPKTMSRDLFQRIAADVFPRTNTLYLSCGFEPLMNRDFPWFLDETAAYRIPNVGFTTNGVLLDEAMARKCVEIRVHEISLSLDASKKETYESIRPGSSWERVLGNIRGLAALRKSENSSFPRIRLNYVLMKRNIEQVVDFVDLAADLGADILDFRHVVVFDVAEEMRQESLLDSRERSNQWLLKAKERADRLGLQVPYLPLFPRWPLKEDLRRWWDQYKKRWRGEPRCRSPWEMLVITPLGFVGPCVGWQRNAPLGNLATQALDEILDSPEMQTLRAGLLGQGPTADSCRQCPTISCRSTQKSAFSEIEMDILDRIWLETYRNYYGWEIEDCG